MITSMTSSEEDGFMSVRKRKTMARKLLGVHVNKLVYFVGSTVAMSALLTGCLTSLLEGGLKTLIFQKVVLN